MKKYLAIFLVLSMTVALAACGGPSDDEIKAIRDVSFEGAELTVTLGANKSTGYEWDYEIYGECIEPSVGRSFKLLGSKGEATGEEITGFEGKSEGTAVIVFTTPNGWDGTGEGDGYTVNVTVDADGSIFSASGSEGAKTPEPGPESAPEESAWEPLPAPAPETVPEPVPEPEPTPKTSITIDELKEGTYTGTISGGETVNDSETIYTTFKPGYATVTIKNGQLTFYSESVTSAYGVLQGVKTPQSPDGSMIFSGTLPLQQSGDAVTVGGELTSSGKGASLNHTDMKFDSWSMTERSGNSKYPCTVYIAMTEGVPVATITVDVKGKLNLTTNVPLALASVVEETGSTEPLSAPYAEMLKSGDYQYTYSLSYEGKPYTATIASYNGMLCRNVVSDDGTFSQRVITREGRAWKVDDLTGTVVDGGTENAETLPDYAVTLTFVASKALETGAIGDAYDFEHEGQKCNMVFLFTPEGELVALYVTVGSQTSQMEILNFSSVGNDRKLFDIPQ